MAGARRRVLVVTGGVFLAGFVLVWLGVMPGLSGIDACTDLGDRPEGTTASSRPALFPPGTIACEYEAPGGEVTSSGYVPWFEWLLLAFGSALAGLATLALFRSRRADAAG